MNLFEIKRGATLPTLGATLTTRLVGNLTGCTVVMRLVTQPLDSESPSTVVLEVPMTIINAAAGTVSYQWVFGDTAEEGCFWAEFWITTGDGNLMKLPISDKINVTISGDNS